MKKLKAAEGRVGANYLDWCVCSISGEMKMKAMVMKGLVDDSVETDVGYTINLVMEELDDDEKISYPRIINFLMKI